MKNQSFKILCSLLIVTIFYLHCTDWDLGEEDPPDPVNLEITGVTDSTVSLRWSRSEDVDFKSYTVYYSLSDIVDTTDKAADTMNFSHDTVKTVSGLEPEKHYYFRVIVTTHRTLISASNIVDTTTLKNVNALTLKLLKPVAVSESSIALKWEKGWVSTFNRYFIYYDTTATVDSADKCIDTVDNVLLDTIQGLQRKKAYWFRVYLDMNGIPKAGSNIDSVTTPDGKPGKVTLAVDRNSIIDTAIIVKWGKSRDADFSRYLLFYDTVAKLDTFTVFDTTASNVFVIDSVKDTLKTVLPLKRKQKYWFAVYVQDTSQFITASNVDSATTSDGKPVAVSMVIDRNKVTDTSVTLHWTKNKEADFKRYLVYYDTTAKIDTFTLVDTTDSNFISVDSIADTSTTIKSLQRKKRYWFTVYVEDKSRLMTACKADSVTTDDGLPEPAQLTVGAATDTSVKLNWSKNAEADFNRYAIYFSDTSYGLDTIKVIDTSHADFFSIKTVRTDTSDTVMPLKRNTTYYFIVYTEDKYGLLSHSSIKSAKTDDGMPEPVKLSIDTSSISDTSVKLSWTKSADYDFKNYSIYFDTKPVVDSSDSLLRTIQSKDTTSLTVSGLKANTIYRFKVYVTSTSGQKAGSNCVYNFPAILTAGLIATTTADTTDTTVQVSWTISFYEAALFKRYVLCRSTSPGVTMQNAIVADFNDISKLIVLDTINKPDTVYYRLYHFHINEEGLAEVRKSNEIQVKIPQYRERLFLNRQEDN